MTGAELPKEVIQALLDLGISDDPNKLQAQALSGGVSSDIWRVCIGKQTVCVKRALEQLRVRQEWLVPVSRNACEAAWFRAVHDIQPQAVPKILGHDAQAGVLVMQYLPPSDYPLWKSQLLAGDARPELAGQLARVLHAIHSATAHKQEYARQFANKELFRALRVEPYLLFTASRHADVAETLQALADTLMQADIALMHGDVSPKNILAGPDGPIILDAETACYGDPAFDLAFCLKHLLLKCIHRPACTQPYLSCYSRLADDYLALADWENRDKLEQRIALLLPALLLARIDGKSPVEYITEDDQRDLVRGLAKQLLRATLARLEDIGTVWQQGIQND